MRRGLETTAHRWSLAGALVVLGTWVFAVPSPRAAEKTEVERGAYLVRAAGCISCHTDKKGKGPPLAGGRGLATPFGTYYSPNITPDPETGIGRWSDEDFLNALQRGIAPDGQHYFPVFPYTTYTRMRRADALAIKAYLFSLRPVARGNKPHAVSAPFGWRWPMRFWNVLFFDAGDFVPDAGQDDEWNRGAYLVKALGHCGECHTPRNLLGAKKTNMDMAGTLQGPDGGVVPNITPDRKTGIGRWTKGDLEEFLDSGMLPDGDFTGSDMGEIVDQSTSRLTTTDRKAMVEYLRSIPPVENRIEAKKKKKK